MYPRSNMRVITTNDGVKTYFDNVRPAGDHTMITGPSREEEFSYC